MNPSTVLKFTSALAGALVALAASQPAIAQSPASYPTRPITIVSPIPPGGSNDVLTRDVAKRLQEKWGQPVVVENKAGAAGSIGRWWTDQARASDRAGSEATACPIADRSPSWLTALSATSTRCSPSATCLRVISPVM